MDPSIDTKELIHLEDGDPDFETPKHIIDATMEALHKGWTHYPPRGGYPELKRAIAKYYSKFGGEYNENNILVTPGSYEAFYMSIAGIVEEGDEVILLTPCYMGYFALLEYLGVRAIEVPMDDERGWRLNVEKLKSRVTEKTKLIIVCSPNNPTGTVFTKEEMKAISDIAIDKDLLVLSDEIYNEFLWEGRKHYSFATIPGMFERTMVNMSLSKTFAMTGWRLGYIVADEAILRELGKMPVEYRPPSFVMRGAIAAFEGPWKPTEDMAYEYYKRITYLHKRLNEIDGLSCPKPEGAFYLFPNIAQIGKNSAEFTITLAKFGKLLVMPGMAFGEVGEYQIRLALVRPIEVLEKAAQAIEATIKSL